jgi:putative transcriptional regulator
MTNKEREAKEKHKLQKKFGAHLIKIRQTKGITAAELSRLCEMERSNIARLETGRMNPSLFVLKKLSDGLGIELNDLLKGL